MAAISSSLVCIVLVSYCLIGTMGVTRYGRLRQKYDVVVKEVMELRKSQKKMREDMKGMKEVSKALKALCIHLDSSPDPDEGKEVDDKLEEPFQIYSLEVNDGHFRIEYDGNVTGEVVNTEREAPILNMTSMAPERLISTTKGLITGPVTSGSNYVSILAGDFVAAVSFKSKTISTPKINFAPHRMKSDVQKNIVFESGHTTEFKVNMSKIGLENFSLGIYTPSKDRDGRVNLVTSGSPGIVNITAKKEYPEHSEVSITINEDKQDHEGFLFLSQSTYMDVESLEYLFYGVYQLFEVKRSDHKDPFEVGYIGFVRNEYAYMGFNVHCAFGKICPLTTELVGNLPDDVTLWKKNGSEKTQLEVPKQRREFGRFVVTISFYLPSTSHEDEGIYIYRGTSHNGTVVEKEFGLTISY